MIQQHLVLEPRVQVKRYLHHSPMHFHILHHRRQVDMVLARHQRRARTFLQPLLLPLRQDLDYHRIRSSPLGIFTNLVLVYNHHRHLDRPVQAMSTAPHTVINRTTMRPFVPVYLRFYPVLQQFVVHRSSKIHHHEPRSATTVSLQRYDSFTSQSYLAPTLAKGKQHFRPGKPVQTAHPLLPAFHPSPWRNGKQENLPRIDMQRNHELRRLSQAVWMMSRSLQY